ncbi:MAG: hypothetical protein GY845_07185 [Planctomycetes bacterium]|nr:hypothetical protein [Planctomycetota bacterium]
MKRLRRLFQRDNNTNKHDQGSGPFSGEKIEQDEATIGNDKISITANPQVSTPGFSRVMDSEGKICGLWLSDMQNIDGAGFLETLCSPSAKWDTLGTSS